MSVDREAIYEEDVMGLEKRTLSLLELDAEAAVELPAREMLRRQRPYINLNIVNVVQININVQVCGIANHGRVDCNNTQNNGSGV